jgi:hypothetical protein
LKNKASDGADGTDANFPTHSDGSKSPWPGLSQKAVLALAREFAGWAAPEDGIRNRLTQYGATGEAVEIDTQKVLECMAEEARRADEY